MYVWKFSEPVDWDKHSDGIFRRTLKIGKNSTKNLEKQQKKLRKKTWKPWNWEKIFGRHPDCFAN